MGFFRDLFKSKATKEAEALLAQWYNELNQASKQLRSSKYNYNQVRSFLNLLSGRDKRNWLSRIQILVRNNLFDGTPLLSKFFIRSVNESTIKCRIAIHDSSILEPIKEAGFGIVRLGGPNIYERNIDEQAAMGIFTMEFTDTYYMTRIVEKCDEYYKALIRVKERTSPEGDIICYPKYTKIEWNGGAFSFETELTPTRVDEIIAALPSDCKYLREYRRYLIEKLAEASISTSSVGVRKVKTVAYNQPVVYCWIYSDFEKRHLSGLNYQAKNKEFESVINEIREAAQKKIETEI
jgi:hypothetical protein